MGFSAFCLDIDRRLGRDVREIAETIRKTVRDIDRSDDGRFTEILQIPGKQSAH
jgi:hypothetical protein